MNQLQNTCYKQKRVQKYVGDDQGILNLNLMQQLYHIVAYNLAKSRTARDGNKILKRKNFRPKHLKLNGLVLVRDHTSKAFEAKATDHHIIDFCGHNHVLAKDNYGTIKKVHIKNVKPIEMDIVSAEFFRKEREQCMTRDAKHVMPIKQIPDLQWEFDENINQMETTVYCIKGVEGETSETAEEAPETTKDITTMEASETVADTGTTETLEPVEHTEATEVPEPVEHTEATEVPEPVEDTENIEAPEKTEATEAVETIEIAEAVTDCTETSQEVEEQQGKHLPCMPTPPKSPLRDNSNLTKIQNMATEEATKVTTGTEQAIQKIHQSQVHKSAFPWRCSYKDCFDCLRTIEGLLKHGKTHGKESWDDTPTPEDKKQWYICSLCGETFDKLAELMTHTRVHSENKYKCDKCDWHFYLISVLSLHGWDCHDTRHYACEWCVEYFDSAERLHTHIQSKHHFKCSICYDYFPTEDELRDHEKKKHGGLQPDEQELQLLR